MLVENMGICLEPHPHVEANKKVTRANQSKFNHVW